MGLKVIPITLSEAHSFVSQFHRHHKPSVGGIFALGAAVNEKIVGVAVVGRPVARRNQDGYTAEVTRVATDGTRNACSFLYGRAWRVAQQMGYKRMLTYTLSDEPGTSLKGAGWECLGEAGGGSWSSKSRPRVDKHPLQTKMKWMVS